MVCGGLEVVLVLVVVVVVGGGVKARDSKSSTDLFGIDLDELLFIRRALLLLVVSVVVVLRLAVEVEVSINLR